MQPKSQKKENHQYENYYGTKYHYRQQTKFNDQGVTFNGVCHCCDIYTHTLKVIARKTMQICK